MRLARRVLAMAEGTRCSTAGDRRGARLENAAEPGGAIAVVAALLLLL